MKILLIAGHGDGDSGACAYGFKEADWTREVVKLLADEMRDICDVTIADTSKNYFEYLKTHSYNFRPYDYVLEIHFNKFNEAANGTEIYVTTSEQGTGVESAIVRQLANDVGFVNRGVKRTNWSVISKVKAQGVSAALLEVCFIDNVSDNNAYRTLKKSVISAIASGIAEGFGLKAPKSNSHWAEKYCDKLASLGYLDKDVWKYYECDMPVSYGLALLDNITGGRWGSNEADTSIHWAQPVIISLCGKGIITDKQQYIDLITNDANMSNALCLALMDSVTGGMCKRYKDRKTDHWARNCLDSLCDKGIITTPEAYTNFEAATSYGCFMGLVCNAFDLM